MAFQRPTLVQLIDRVQADFVSRLELAGAVLLRSVVVVLSRVIAGATHMLHGHLEYLGRQLFADQSDDPFLVRQAALFGLTKTAPDYAHGTVSATGTNTSVIPAGSVLLGASGLEYTTDADATISAGTATIAITAVVAGAASTLVEDAVLSFESPVSGVDGTVTVTASTVDGTDQEKTEELRVRVLARMSEPAHGGNVADYVAWAKEVPGVTRVWVTGLGLGYGTVVVRFARDDDDTGPIPDSGEVAAVQAKLGVRAPAHATVTAIAPIDAPQNFTIHIVPDTVALRAAVTAELADLIVRDGEPAGTLLLSAIRTAIGSTAGLTNYTMSSPSADVVLSAGQLPSMGTITWS